MPDEIRRGPRTPTNDRRKSRGVPPAHPVKRPDPEPMPQEELDRIIALNETPGPRAFVGPMSPVGGKRVD